MRRARGKPPELEVFHDLNGAEVTGSMERAELFNSYFVKAFGSNPHASVEQQTDKVDSSIEPNFDPTTVRNCLAASSASTATDPDSFCILCCVALLMAWLFPCR